MPVATIGAHRGAGVGAIGNIRRTVGEVAELFGDEFAVLLTIRRPLGPTSPLVLAGSGSVPAHAPGNP